MPDMASQGRPMTESQQRRKKTEKKIEKDGENTIKDGGKDGKKIEKMENRYLNL